MRKRHGEAFSSFTQYVAATQFWYCNATKSMGTVREWFLLFWHLKGVHLDIYVGPFHQLSQQPKVLQKWVFYVMSCHVILLLWKTSLRHMWGFPLPVKVWHGLAHALKLDRISNQMFTICSFWFLIVISTYL